MQLRRALIDLGIGLWRADPAARRYGQQLRGRGKKGGVIGCAMANRANKIPGSGSLCFRHGEHRVANAWVSLGTFAAFCGWAVLTTGIFRPWLGWLMVASGIGLALSRFVWTTNAWLLPYALFWIWVIAVWIRLLRRPA